MARLNWPGLAVVAALHGLALYALWQHRLIPTPVEAATVFVNFITPPQPPEKRPPLVESPTPVKLEKPRPVDTPPPPRQLVVEAPAVLPAEPVAPPPSVAPVPVPVAALPPEPPVLPPPAPKPAGPVTLSTELSVACPERTPPAYPAVSRRLGEEGKVVLRVELDEDGRISAARVATGSGYGRLDEAALVAVRNWRCQPAQRNGQPVRAVALQPFNFVLEGR